MNLHNRLILLRSFTSCTVKDVSLSKDIYLNPHGIIYRSVDAHILHISVIVEIILGIDSMYIITYLNMK